MTSLLPLMLALAPLAVFAQEPAPELFPPRLVTFVAVNYPSEAQAAGVVGEARLALTLDPQGRVISVELLEDPGHGLGEAAVAAAWALVFEPAQGPEGPTAVIIAWCTKIPSSRSSSGTGPCCETLGVWRNGHATAPSRPSRTPVALAACLDRSLSMSSPSEDDGHRWPTFSSDGWPRT